MYPALKIIRILFLFYYLYPLTLVWGDYFKQFRVDWHRALALRANIKIGMLGSYWCCKNYHKFGGLKQNFILFSVLEARSLNSVSEVKALTGFFLPDVEEKPFPCLFPVFRGCLNFLACGLFFHLQSMSLRSLLVLSHGHLSDFDVSCDPCIRSFVRTSGPLGSPGISSLAQDT